MNPLAKTEVVFADDFRSDENVVARLFKVFAGKAKEAEALGCQLEHAIGFNFRSVELGGSAIVEIVALLTLAGLTRGLVALAWMLLLLLRMGCCTWLIVLAGAAFPLVTAALAAGFTWWALTVALLRFALLEISILPVVRWALTAFLAASGSFPWAVMVN